MLRPLKDWLRGPRAAPVEQLDLPLADVLGGGGADELMARLRSLGLRRIERCTLTRNRRTLVSWRGSDLRVHEGFLSAPEGVHRAIVAFVESDSRATRRQAQRIIARHPVPIPAPLPRAPARMRAANEAEAGRLESWHRRLNDEHFGGSLRTIRVRVCRRMRSRLGHYARALGERCPAEIAISARHLRRHGLEETLHTLLHEMVHQWQDESGHPIDHGRTFRAKARELGITPAAQRTPRSEEGRTKSA